MVFCLFSHLWLQVSPASNNQLCSMEVFWPGSTSAWSCQKFIILLQNVPGFSKLILSAQKKVCNTCPYLLFLPMMSKARMPSDLKMKTWILRPFPHFNSLLMLSQGCASILLSVRNPWRFLCFLWAQGWAARAALFKVRGSTDHVGQWKPVVGGQRWKFSHPYSSKKPGNTIHKKPGGPETKLCLTRHIASDFPVPRFR